MFDDGITPWERWVVTGLDDRPIKIIFCIGKITSPLNQTAI
jgi:hypothetical protein